MQKGKIEGATNFTLPELCRSDTAIRFGLQNVPSIAQESNLILLARNCLQPIRDEFGGIRVLSGFRSVKVNKKIGGSEDSNHCRGEAADIEPTEDVKLIVIMEWICQNLEFRELIAEFFPFGWIHLAYRGGGNSRIIKLKDKDHDYSRIGLLELLTLYPRT